MQIKIWGRVIETAVDVIRILGYMNLYWVFLIRIRFEMLHLGQ